MADEKHTIDSLEVLRTFLKFFRKYQTVKRYIQEYPILNDYMDLTCLPIKEFFVYAFVWRRTKEGHIYWSDKNEEWLKLTERFNVKSNIDITKL